MDRQSVLVRHERRLNRAIRRARFWQRYGVVITACAVTAVISCAMTWTVRSQIEEYQIRRALASPEAQTVLHESDKVRAAKEAPKLWRKRVRNAEGHRPLK